MHKFLLTFLLVVSSAALAKTQETTGDTAAAVRNEIIKLENEKDRDLAAGGSAMADFLDLHDADGIIWTGGGRDTGDALTKPELVAEWRSGARKMVSVNHHDYRVQVYENGNVAVVTYLGDETMQRQSKVNSHRTKTTEVFIKHDGVWLTVVHIVRNISTD